MSARRTVAAGLFALTLLTACGDSQAEISARAQRQLQTRLEEVRTAVALADTIGAQSALEDLERSVSQLLDAGQLSEDRAAEILAAARAVGARLSLLPTPEPITSPSSEPSETTDPAPSDKPDTPSKDDKGDGKGKGEGNGKGDGKGHD